MTARNKIAACCLSVAALAGLYESEGFAPAAMQPVPGDEWTYGIGSTIKDDGSKVKPGDTITRGDAEVLAKKQIRDKYERGIHACAGDVAVTQGEYDALIDLAYNIGYPKVCSSSIVKYFRAGDYAGGCAAIFLFDKLNGVHCREPKNTKTVPGCRGIMNRRLHQYELCKGKAA